MISGKNESVVQLMSKRLRYFAIASFIAIAILGVLLALLERQVSENAFVELGQHSNSVLATTLANAMKPQLAALLSQQELENINSNIATKHLVSNMRNAVQRLAHDIPIERVNFYDLTETIVFSTEPALMGVQESWNPHMQLGIRGEIASKLIPARDCLTFLDKTTDCRIVESYIPFRRDPGQPIEGVFELYMDVSPSLASVRDFQFAISGSIILILFILYIVLLLIARRTHKIIELQENEIAEKSSFSAQFLVNQEEERTQVAKLLHDNITQTLSVIKYDMERAVASNSQSVDNKEKAMNSLLRDVALLQDTVDKVRGIYMDLRPPTLDDLGIQATINWFCDQIQNTQSNIRIEKLIDVQEQTIPEDIKISVFRTIQDTFASIIAPRDVTTVYLWFVQTGPSLELIIKDDGGNGFHKKNTGAVNPSISFGLSSLRERAAISGGTLSLDSERHAGTSIRIVWWLNH